MSDPRPESADLEDEAIDPKDLDFLRALVSEGPRAQAGAGLIFLIAGIAYGVQCLLILGQIRGLIPNAYHLTIAIAPTVILFAAIGWVMWEDRHNKSNGVAQRALNAAWGSAGMTNMVMVCVFGYVSFTQQNFIYWMVYAVMVCAVQGAMWYIAAMIRRKVWLGAVSTGWFAAAIGTGLTLEYPEVYILIVATALFVCMALPGYVMWRGAPKGMSK